MVAYGRSRISRLGQPFGGEPFRELALRIFICVDTPGSTGVQRPFEIMGMKRWSLSGFRPVTVEPQAGPDRHVAAQQRPPVPGHVQHKVHRLDEMWRFAARKLAITQ